MPEEKIHYVIKADKYRPIQDSRPQKLPFNSLFADIIINDSCDNKLMDTAKADIRIAKEIISPRPCDPVYERFTQLKRISGTVYRNGSDRSRDYLFYKQALFMSDFTDDYLKFAPFNSYYPNYQMMNFEQFRTYFTWRTKVRQGEVRQTDLSYVFLYLYELLNNVGTADGQDGLNKLLFIWNSYHKYSAKLDRYMADWLREYSILNQCEELFTELSEKEPLLRPYYPDTNAEASFEYYCAYSSYKIKQSVFYTPETEAMLSACFSHIMQRLESLLIKEGTNLNYLLSVKGSEQLWFPLHNAIFYMRPDFMPKSEKVIRLKSGYEYRFKNGRWTSKRLGGISGDGKQLLSYIFKRMEQLLRKAAKFKYKLNADDRYINKDALDKLLPGIGSAGLLREIDAAVKEFYINSKKTVITVDEDRLNRIRQNALITQKKLIVNPEEDSADESPNPAPKLSVPEIEIVADIPLADTKAEATVAASEPEDIWESLVSQLDELEAKALKLLLGGAAVKQIQDLARDSGLMLEVLIDGINQKAFDTIGDTILEFTDEIVIYEDYINQLRTAIERE